MQNAAYVRLKNLTVDYTFPSKLTKKIRVEKLKVYFSGENLLTFSPFKLWDPEMGGGKGMAYPTQRTFNLGVQITFK